MKTHAHTINQKQYEFGSTIQSSSTILFSSLVPTGPDIDVLFGRRRSSTQDVILFDRIQILVIHRNGIQYVYSTWEDKRNRRIVLISQRRMRGFQEHRPEHVDRTHRREKRRPGGPGVQRILKVLRRMNGRRTIPRTDSGSSLGVDRELRGSRARGARNDGLTPLGWGGVGFEAGRDLSNCCEREDILYERRGEATDSKSRQSI